MKIRLNTGDRLILSGPPGGVGTVVLLLIVGLAMSAGGAAFVRVGLTNSQLTTTLMGGLIGIAGLISLLGGVGTALTRDRLELDRVTRRGIWTRRLLGRAIVPRVEFAFEHAKHVTVSHFVESAPRTDRAGSTSVEKVRARLLITKPRRAIVLDEAERQRAPRVREVADTVAGMLGLEVDAPMDGTSE